MTPAGVEWPLSYNTLLRTGDKAKPGEKYGFGQNVAQNGDFVYEVNSALTNQHFHAHIEYCNQHKLKPANEEPDPTNKNIY